MADYRSENGELNRLVAPKVSIGDVAARQLETRSQR